MADDDNTIVQDPLKPWKYFIFPLLKPNSLHPTFMKGLLAIIIFTGFSLCYFSFFPRVKLRLDCPECYQSFIHQALTNDIELVEKTNISHILFGIGGSAETWGRRRHYWWKPNVTRGYVGLDKEPNNIDTWPQTSPPFRVSSDTSRFKYTNVDGSRSAIRIARIVKERFQLGLENVRWFVMGDDDTVFFTDNLLNVLNKYDHEEMYYIGGNSESIEQNLVHLYSTGYGGAGFAISYPLAEELVRILDGCIDRYAAAYGSDQKISSCLAEIGMPITKELGFHQMDIRGNPFGFLSAHPLAPLISLHHLDYVQPLFSNINRVISVAWGYSVQLYPFLLTGKELSTPILTFLTWGSWSTGPFTFNTRVMSLDRCERPLVYYYDGATKSFGSTKTATLYKRDNETGKKRCERQHYEGAYLVNGFNVSATVMDPGYWNQAPPHRQCCEVIDGSDQQNGIVHVRIRSCNKWESVSPP